MNEYSPLFDEDFHRCHGAEELTHYHKKHGSRSERDLTCETQIVRWPVAQKRPIMY